MKGKICSKLKLLHSRKIKRGQITMIKQNFKIKMNFKVVGKRHLKEHQNSKKKIEKRIQNNLWKISVTLGILKIQTKQLSNGLSINGLPRKSSMFDFIIL